MPLRPRSLGTSSPQATPVWITALMVALGVALLLYRPWDAREPGITLNPSVGTPSDAASATDGEDSDLVDDPAATSLLTEISPNTYQSPAGLVYGPGSQQGHRLAHVMAHARDQPQRPGPHGVFDPSQTADVLQLLDEAYQQALQGDGTQTEQDGRRTIYTVDMGRIIGYVGGQTGNRRGRPDARHLRLVLEDNRVITAYPLVPRR